MNIDVGDALRRSRNNTFRQGRQPDDTGVRPFVPSRHERNARGPEVRHTLGLIMRAGWRVTLPAAGLFALLALMYLYRAEPATLFESLFAGSSAWLSLGALCVPLTFLAVHLTSRRYGPAIATAQVLTAWAAFGLVTLIRPIELSFEIGAAAIVASRIGLALPVSLLLAQMVAIVAFDATRSVRWWKGPSHGFFWASLVFALTFYPAAYLGTEDAWFPHLTEYLAVSLIVSALLLVPYWIARPLIRPLPGLAGY